MVKKLYKTIGNLKVYLSDIKGYKVGKDIVIGEREKDRELLILKAVREYNLKFDGIKDTSKSVEPILVKCRRNPLLIPHRLFREECKIKRRQKWTRISIMGK